ncbi:MAG: response regulator transcription factor [Acidimicrobiia bacterium]
MHVLLVEDDDSIAEPLARGLVREGFAITRVASGEAALNAVGYDLVLLDLGLPGIDGFEVCRVLRSRSDIPIIVTTARGEEIDRVVGLEIGADDYMVKPFGLRELVARIRAVTRRVQRVSEPSEPSGAGDVTVGPLRIDRRRHCVTLADCEISLTPKEYQLLEFLARDPGAACTRDAIIEAVWDEHWFGPTKTLDVHVASVRKKLGDPQWIETIRGVGFRLSEPNA